MEVVESNIEGQREDTEAEMQIEDNEVEEQEGAQQEQPHQESSIKCNICGMRFNDKRDLRVHIKDAHKSFKPCRDFANGGCESSSESCRYNHIVLSENDHICFKCGHTTTTKTLLMSHVKELHGNIPCTNFQKSECRFSSNSCIFSHRMGTQEPGTSESLATAVTSRPAPQQQDFRQAVLGHKPPDHSEMKQKLLSVFAMMLEQMPPQALPQILNQLQLQQ